MTSGDPAPVGLGLSVPAEPVELREQLRAELLEGAMWEDRFGPELGVGDVLWSAWSGVLGGGGLTRERFGGVVRGYRRELWFWVLGDRMWDQVVSGLAGRLCRRLPG